MKGCIVEKLFRFTVILAIVLAALPGLAILAPRHAAAQATTGTIIAHAVDKHGKPLKGACFVSGFAGGQYVFPDADPVCDSADGADDGTTTISTSDTTASHVLVMVRAPKGYQVGGQMPFSVDAGGSTELTFAPKTGGQPIDLTLVDEHGGPVTGSCLTVYGVDQVGNYTGIVADDCAGKASKGRLSIEGFEPGHYAVFVRTQPKNLAALDTNLPVQLGSQAESKLTIAYVAAGTAKVTVLGPDGSPLANSFCFNFTELKSTNPRFDFACSKQANGEVVTDNLPAGSYSIDDSGSNFPAGTQFPGTPLQVTIKAHTQTEVTIKLVTSGQALVATITDPNGNPIADACAQVTTNPKSGFGVFVGFACNGAQFWGVRPGDYLISSFSSPNQGFAPPPPVKFTVVAGQEADVTVAMVPSATLVVAARDKKSRTNLKDACFEASTDFVSLRPQYDAVACDNADGNVDGLVTFKGVPAGVPIQVVAVSLPNGWALPAAQTVTLEAGATPAIKVAVTQSTSSTFRIRRLGNGRDAIRSTCYLIYASKSGKKGDLIAHRCDYQDYNGEDGLTVIPGMPAGDFIAVETYAPNGVKKVKDTPFTIVAGKDNEIVLTNP